MKNRLIASRAFRLSLLFLLSACLSVALNTDCFASPLSSPGCKNYRASVLIVEAEPGSTDGGTDSAVVKRSVVEASKIDRSDSTGIFVSNPTPKQGEPITVRVADGEASPDSVTFNGDTTKLLPEEIDGKKVKTAVIAIPTQLKTGKHQIAAGNLVSTITVLDGKFGLQRLQLPKSKDNFIASPGEKETINKARQTFSNTKRWQGAFSRPVRTGRMSTRFGVKRVVNGRLLTDYFHSGLDFAAPAGTPIHAAAPGTVLVARTGWRLHGNVVCIDHGRGVVSISIHMTKVNVKEGDEVEAGQVIGTVGNTGRASGPHLHYGIYVNNVASNPEYWFQKQY